MLCQWRHLLAHAVNTFCADYEEITAHVASVADALFDPRWYRRGSNQIANPVPTSSDPGMHWLVSGAQPNDSLFLHYSGHGSQAKDHDSDEVDGYDETICPLDYASAGEIVDDEMNALLVRQLPRGVRYVQGTG